MQSDIVVGIVLLAAATLLLFAARPVGGEPAKFLRFETALVTFPPLILVLLGMGAAEFITGLLSIW